MTLVQRHRLKLMNSEREPAKIPFVHGNNDLYGGDIALLELIKRLDRKRFRPLVVLPNDTRHINRLSAKLAQEGIACRFVRMAVIRRKYLAASGLIMLAVNFVAGVVALMYLIWRNQVALVHSNTIAVPCGPLRLNLCDGPMCAAYPRDSHPTCDRTQDPASRGDEAVRGCRGGLHAVRHHILRIAPVKIARSG